MESGTVVKPFIKCVDYWPCYIPRGKLEAYRQLIDDGQIRKHHVIVNQQTGSTMVEYYSTIPHEWILEELAKRARPDGAVPEAWKERQVRSL